LRWDWGARTTAAAGGGGTGRWARWWAGPV